MSVKARVGLGWPSPARKVLQHLNVTPGVLQMMGQMMAPAPGGGANPMQQMMSGLMGGGGGAGGGLGELIREFTAPSAGARPKIGRSRAPSAAKRSRDRLQFA